MVNIQYIAFLNNAHTFKLLLYLRPVNLPFLIATLSPRHKVEILTFTRSQLEGQRGAAYKNIWSYTFQSGNCIKN